MYELILGANLILFAHYHIPSLMYLVPFILFLLFFAFEFVPNGSPATQTLGRNIAQMIGVLTFSFLVYHLISPIFALVLGTISIIWCIAIGVICCTKIEEEEAAREAQSEIVIDEEEAQSIIVIDEDAPLIS